MENLFAPFPQSARIDGEEYQLNTDFQTVLKIFAVFEDDELVPFEKQAVMLSLLYREIPQNVELAVEFAMQFLSCDEKHDGENDISLYSFKTDAALIYSAMQKSHGVDIFEKPMHWYRFVALFCDMDENTFFARLLHLRKAKATGKLTAEEKQIAATLGSYLDLPKQAEQEPSEEEKLFLHLLNGAGKEE